MSLFLDIDGDPRAGTARLADVLSLYGALGDAACGNPPGFAARKAVVAASLARAAHLPETELQAAYFAGVLHAIGAIGNLAYRRGERLSERLARMESWDVPAQGARVCAEMPWLPPATADIIRWQAECWDGTGYPDSLRWHGIPQSAVMLALADTFVRAGDPEEALTIVSAQSGRAFGPEVARTFTMWFHMTGGEAEETAMPVDALETPAAGEAAAWLDRIADRVDDHLGEAGRWRRIARLTEGAADLLRLDEVQRDALSIAVRLYGSGELGEPEAVESKFDPLARLGIDERAAHGQAAAAFVAGNATLAAAAPILRARSEWYDGTGKPDALLHDTVPPAAALLAGAIAYDALARKDRIDTAGGTQFDPRAVRAILEAARALA